LIAKDPDQCYYNELAVCVDTHPALLVPKQSLLVPKPEKKQQLIQFRTLEARYINLTQVFA
jgi:hypothetical protein